jgi:hypothetical protein
MLRTDFTKIGAIPYLVLLFFSTCVFTLSAESTSEAFPVNTLACNNNVNVSVGTVNTVGECCAQLTIEMILEGENSIPGYDPANYFITVNGVEGDPGGTVELCELGSFEVSITEIDAAGDFVNSCWGNVVIEDKVAPMLVDDPMTVNDPADLSNTSTNEACPCPVGNTDPNCEYAASCLTEVDYLVPAAVDNCGDVSMSFVETVAVNGGDCDITTIHRTYVFTDAFNNKVTSCVNEYRLTPVDVTTEVSAPITQVYLPCGTGTAPSDIFDYAYAEYIALNPVMDPEDVVELAAQAAAAEAFGNLNAYPTAFGFPLIENATLCNTATTLSDLVIFPCDEECTDMTKVIREWTIHDWCSSTSVTFSQQIVTQDLDGPTILVNDSNEFTIGVDPWLCEGVFTFPEPEHLFDDCSNKVSYTVTGPAGVNIDFDPDTGYSVTDAPKGTHIFTYNAVDCCGNITPQDVIVNIVDTTPPVAIAKQDIVLSLTTSINGEGIAKLFTNNIDNGSYDGCSDVHLEIRREEDYCDIDDNLTYNNDGHPFDNSNDSDDGQSVRFCCADLSGAGVDEDGDGVNDYASIKVWMRVWDDGDMDGVYGTDGDNFNETWAYVRLEDKLTPSIQCPPDIVIGCEEDYLDLDLTGEALAVASCDPLNVDFKDFEKTIDGCGAGFVKRQWFVVDNPSIFCVQTITVEGFDTDEIVVTFPDDLTVDCTEDFGDTGLPTWSAGPCDQMAYSVDVDTFRISEGACFKVLKTWHVINWCYYDPSTPITDSDFGEGSWIHTQVIKVLDEEAPEFLSCEDETYPVNDNDDADNDGIICENNAVMLTKTASDTGSCPSAGLDWTVQVDLNGDWTIDYEFSTYLSPNDPFYIAPTQSGEEVKVTLPDAVEGSMINHRVIWRVTDGCGNFRACTSNFMVVDEKAPTPYCTNLSTAFMQNGMVAIWACDFDLGSFDNCTAQDDLRFTFTDTHPDDDPNYIPSLNCASMAFTCDDIPADGSAVPVRMYVSDEKDNNSFCTVFLTILDNAGSCGGDTGSPRMISGQIATPEGELLENVSVQINSNAPEYPMTEMTDGSGLFAFDQVPEFADYVIDGTKNDDYKNGVSTVDIILIQRHLLGIQQLSTVHSVIAADVTGDERVTAADMVDIRKLVLDYIAEFPSNDSWLFLDKSQQLLYANPWPLDQVVSIQNLQSDMMAEDFVAIKVGDVNSSVIVNANGSSTETRGAEALTLNFDDQTVQAGQLTTVTFNATVADFYGAQFALNHPGFELVSIGSDILNITEDNYIKVTPSTTAMSVETMSAVTLDEEALITVVLRAEATTALSEALQLSTDAISNEAYTGFDLTVNDVVLQSNATGYTLMQNTPNPFAGETNIAFSLPTQGEATLTVYDITGKVAYTSTQDYSAGVHSVTINSQDLGSEGVWFYRLNSGKFSATKKLTVIR